MLTLPQRASLLYESLPLLETEECQDTSNLLVHPLGLNLRLLSLNVSLAIESETLRTTFSRAFQHALLSWDETLEIDARYKLLEGFLLAHRDANAWQETGTENPQALAVFCGNLYRIWFSGEELLPGASNLLSRVHSCVSDCRTEIKQRIIASLQESFSPAKES